MTALSVEDRAVGMMYVYTQLVYSVSAHHNM